MAVIEVPDILISDGTKYISLRGNYISDGLDFQPWEYKCGICDGENYYVLKDTTPSYPENTVVLELSKVYAASNNNIKISRIVTPNPSGPFDTIVFNVYKDNVLDGTITMEDSLDSMTTFIYKSIDGSSNIFFQTGSVYKLEIFSIGGNEGNSGQSFDYMISNPEVSYVKEDRYLNLYIVSTSPNTCEVVPKNSQGEVTSPTNVEISYAIKMLHDGDYVGDISYNVGTTNTYTGFGSSNTPFTSGTWQILLTKSFEDLDYIYSIGTDNIITF